MLMLWCRIVVLHIIRVMVSAYFVSGVVADELEVRILEER